MYPLSIYFDSKNARKWLSSISGKSDKKQSEDYIKTTCISSDHVQNTCGERTGLVVRALYTFIHLLPKSTGNTQECVAPSQHD